MKKVPLLCGSLELLETLTHKGGTPYGTQVGRDRSIVLCHRVQCAEKGWQQLMAYTTGKISDGALFVAEDFVEDIGRAIGIDFRPSSKGLTLSRNIENWLARHPRL